MVVRSRPKASAHHHRGLGATPKTTPVDNPAGPGTVGVMEATLAATAAPVVPVLVVGAVVAVMAGGPVARWLARRAAAAPVDAEPTLEALLALSVADDPSLLDGLGPAPGEVWTLPAAARMTNAARGGEPPLDVDREHLEAVVAAYPKPLERLDRAGVEAGLQVLCEVEIERRRYRGARDLEATVDGLVRPLVAPTRGRVAAVEGAILLGLVAGFFGVLGGLWGPAGAVVVGAALLLVGAQSFVDWDTMFVEPALSSVGLTLCVPAALGLLAAAHGGGGVLLGGAVAVIGLGAVWLLGRVITRWRGEVGLGGGDLPILALTVAVPGLVAGSSAVAMLALLGGCVAAVPIAVIRWRQGKASLRGPHPFVPALFVGAALATVIAAWGPGL